MRKQMKIAAVVSATALLAIGASFTSMAAAKTGTWTNEDGTWYCYDKNGDVYENEFCLSNGKEFYVGDDGALVYSQWVEHDGDMYYINSEGAKTTSSWKWLTPYEDEDADEEWYWFTSSGKRKESGNITYNGKKHYFDAEGKMLTGWVDTSDKTVADENTTVDNLVYCDETGARVVKDWVYVYEPGVDVEEDDLDDYDEYWYYLKSLGNPQTGKGTNINGETYLFDADGRMLSGWIALVGDDTYEEIDESSSEEPLSKYADTSVYYADTDDGHVKKNKWVKEWNNQDFDAADPDVDKNWYWIQKDGKVYIPTTSSNATQYDFEDGEADTPFVPATDCNATEKVINDETYAFDQDGKMIYGFVEIEGDMYYFGEENDGSRHTGSVSIEDECGEAYKFYFGTEDDDGYNKGVGITGAKNGKLYIDGLLQKADGDYKYKVVNVGDIDEDDEDEIFIINKSGSIQTSKKAYEDDGYTVVDASKWAFVPTAGATKGSASTYNTSDVVIWE